MGALPQIGLKWVTGVVLSDSGDELVAALAATTPRGPREMDTVELPVPEEGLAEGLRELEKQSKLRGKVVVGIDARAAFFATKGRGADTEDSDDAVREALGARGRASDFVLDWDDVKLPSGPHFSAAMCDRAFAEEAYAGLSGVKPANRSLQPVPLGLYRLALQRDPGPRRWRTMVRLIPGKSRALAVLSHAGAPLAYRLFECPPRSRLARTETALQGLLLQAREHLGLDKVDGLLVHAGDDDDTEELVGGLEEALDIPVRSAALVSLDARSAALGLALGNLKPAATELDLFRNLRPPAGLRENFPWATTVLLLGIAIGSFWMLRSEASALEARVARLKRQTSTDSKVAGTKSSEVGLKHDQLLKELDVAHAFISKRVFWPEVIEELTTVLPEGVVLTLIQGHDSLALAKRMSKQEKRKAKKYLTAKKGGKVKVQKDVLIGGAVRIAKGETAIPQIPQLLRALKGSKLIAREFPVVGGANIELKEVKGPDGPEIVAEFTIECALDSKKK